MRTIFLADAHLVSPDEQNYRLLLRFLRELEGNTETLFVMGDLFDFWLGFPSNPLCQFDEMLAALQSLVQSGCRLVYFEGNHDFHMGTIFRQRLGAEIHTGPAVITVQGRRLFLCHGDQINGRDHGYRLLRLLLHNRLTAALVNHVPPLLALRVRSLLQRVSRAGYQVKLQRWNYREIIRIFARSIRKKGCDGLVTGHFHLAFCEQLEGSPFVILSLGDWMEQFTYGEIAAGTLSLKTYPSPPKAACFSEQNA
jgi:UDP-2,3-diacylglucosamine hydrolase